MKEGGLGEIVCLAAGLKLYGDLNKIQPKSIRENETQPDRRLDRIIEALTEGGRELKSD